MINFCFRDSVNQSGEGQGGGRRRSRRLPSLRLANGQPASFGTPEDETSKSPPQLATCSAVHGEAISIRVETPSDLKINDDGTGSVVTALEDNISLVHDYITSEMTFKDSTNKVNSIQTTKYTCSLAVEEKLYTLETSVFFFDNSLLDSKPPSQPIITKY